MKLIHSLVVLFVVSASAGVSTLTAASRVTAESVRNYAYHPAIRNSIDKLEVRKIRLVNGLYEKGRRFVDADYEYLKAGQIALGDIDGDGDIDAAVILYHMKGDHTSTQLAVVLDVRGTPTHVASREFLEGTEIMDLKLDRPLVRNNHTGQLERKGMVIVEVSNETCCNGQGKTVSFIVENQCLVGQDPFQR